MGLLVGAMDIATANNTVAIVMANPIAKEMSEEYGITPRKAASILDTFSCIFQGIIPYGAQMLVAIAAAHELGYQVSAFEIIPNLFYPFLLAVSSFFFIAIDGKRRPEPCPTLHGSAPSGSSCSIWTERSIWTNGSLTARRTSCARSARAAGRTAF